MATYPALFSHRLDPLATDLKSNINRLERDRRCTTAVLSLLTILCAAGAMAIVATCYSSDPGLLKFCYGGATLLTGASLVTLTALALYRLGVKRSIQQLRHAYGEEVGQTFTPESIREHISDEELPEVIAQMNDEFFEGFVATVLDDAVALKAVIADPRFEKIAYDPTLDPTLFERVGVEEKALLVGYSDDYFDLDVYHAMTLEERGRFLTLSDSEYVLGKVINANPDDALREVLPRAAYLLGCKSHSDPTVFVLTEKMTPDQAAAFLLAHDLKACLEKYGARLTEPLLRRIATQPEALVTVFESTPWISTQVGRALGVSEVPPIYEQLPVIAKIVQHMSDLGRTTFFQLLGAHNPQAKSDIEDLLR